MNVLRVNLSKLKPYIDVISVSKNKLNFFNVIPFIIMTERENVRFLAH